MANCHLAVARVCRLANKIGMANRIRAARKAAGITLEQLAEASGISTSYLSRIEAAKRGLSMEAAVAIAGALRVAVNEITDEFDAESLDRAFSDDWVLPEREREPIIGDIENLRIHSGAGGGGLLSVETGADGYVSDPAMSDGFWTFPDSIKSGWRHLDRIKAMPVTGDSMEPTLAKGSTVFVDTTHIYPSPEDIYAIDYGDGLVIKRVKLVPRSDKILVISDNRERYGDPDELRREDVRVYGRVVAWFQWRG